MTVYVDPLFDCRPFIRPGSGWRWSHSCHMFADSDEELHAFAKRLGLRRSWHQPHPPHRLSHYDLNPSRRAMAVRLGATEVSFTVTADFMKKTRRQQAPSVPRKNVLEVAAQLFVHARNRLFWDYFGGRQLSRETLDHFLIGFAPGRPLLAQQEFQTHDFLAAGLLDARHYRKTGGLKPRHENVFSFPYFEDGEVQGMVFRSTAEKADPGGRYTNLDSCDSLPCPPGRVVRPFFYGPDGALMADPVTLVEGPVDMLRCWQAGIKNVVALCGLGVSDDKILELLLQPRTVRLFFDWDYEGRRRAFQLAMRYQRYLHEQQATQTDDTALYCGRLEVVAVPTDWDDPKWMDPGEAPSDKALRKLYGEYRVDSGTYIDQVLGESFPTEVPWLEGIVGRFKELGGYLNRPLADPVRPAPKRVK